MSERAAMKIYAEDLLKETDLKATEEDLATAVLALLAQLEAAEQRS